MFEIVTSKDFYAMLVEDFDDFVAEPHSGRRALHCAITAYHLHEWVWAEWLSRDKAARDAMGIAGRDKKYFLQWIEKYCVWFRLVQELANGSKHLGRNIGFDTLKVSGFGEGPFGIGPFGQGYLLLDLGEDALEHRWQPAAHILEVVVRFWRDFFLKYIPSDDLPTSRHHID
ncbi:hypothetical protein ACFYE8_26320 [Rhizobium leguminosarum]|uniref:hypothetical protein n=1 Tax=Rhizobium leguminosarum TaxID=384 RepID=UPI0036D9E125